MYMRFVFIHLHIYLLLKFMKKVNYTPSETSLI
jgi:hypothetical protein